jgi:glycerol-3-phosphate acyltransferase PlsY
MPDPISWSFDWRFFAGALLFGYLLGSIPFGIVLTRLAGAPDPRGIGSGNIGATNVLRTGRRDLAALTLVLDAAKGTAAVVAAASWGPDIALVAAYGAMLGHMVPVWLRFRGGKGVATYLGVLAGLDLAPIFSIAVPAALAFAAIWIAVAALTRFSSLAALVATLAMPVVMWRFGEPQLKEAAIIIGLAIVFTHRGNISRLARGTEARIGGG